MVMSHALLLICLTLALPAVSDPAPVPLRTPVPVPVLGPVSGPVPVDPNAVLSPFQAPSSPWGPGHRGLDLAARRGQQVLSWTSGTVAFAGRVAGKPVVVVSLTGQRRVTYEPVIASMKPGQSVHPGDVLGHVAAAGGHCGGDTTGRATHCIHVGLRTKDGYRDPLVLLRGPAVLKPLPRLDVRLRPCPCSTQSPPASESATARGCA
ncbi:MAG: M23 family metallopeptidase [Candidatus Nanopelagicales bacterium]|nr:M23 family metallopeptidase [Candidatus Nanopelagicales bacterium]MCF8536551.1 M23 family metallopeptidase [Candidatus Nanopelagicales bacterium]MCF8541849.1 M23 family metallopeptidase [Candidatus Nanopelagicales bacterium]MCF8556359.1 M23 family metallopeptidase [Candidatus Nanopelagicales bacterium]